MISTQEAIGLIGVDCLGRLCEVCQQAETEGMHYWVVYTLASDQQCQHVYRLLQRVDMLEAGGSTREFELKKLCMKLGLGTWVQRRGPYAEVAGMEWLHEPIPGDGAEPAPAMRRAAQTRAFLEQDDPELLRFSEEPDLGQLLNRGDVAARAYLGQHPSGEIPMQTVYGILGAELVERLVKICDQGKNCDGVVYLLTEDNRHWQYVMALLARMTLGGDSDANGRVLQMLAAALRSRLPESQHPEVAQVQFDLDHQVRDGASVRQLFIDAETRAMLQIDVLGRGELPMIEVSEILGEDLLQEFRSMCDRGVTYAELAQALQEVGGIEAMIRMIRQMEEANGASPEERMLQQLAAELRNLQAAKQQLKTTPK
jgi:hypothetical protein